MKPFIVVTYQYDSTLHQNVIVETKEFTDGEEARCYFDSKTPKPNSSIWLKGDYGYNVMAVKKL